MKRKRHTDRFHPDKYKDGPKKPTKSKAPRFGYDDDDLDEALDQWKDMRSWQSEPGEDNGWDEEE